MSPFLLSRWVLKNIQNFIRSISRGVRPSSPPSIALLSIIFHNVLFGSWRLISFCQGSIACSNHSRREVILYLHIHTVSCSRQLSHSPRGCATYLCLWLLYHRSVQWYCAYGWAVRMSFFRARYHHSHTFFLQVYTMVWESDSRVHSAIYTLW